MKNSQRDSSCLSSFSFNRTGKGFPGGSSGKEPICQCRRHKRCRFGLWLRYPEEGNGKSTPVFLPTKSHQQRSLVGYIPWEWHESDMTEHHINSIHWHSKCISRKGPPFLAKTSYLRCKIQYPFSMHELAHEKCDCL